MAKIKFGMMMTDASGKLGGQVFSKNRGGSYVRTKVTPNNPQTTFQTSVRAIFASISSAWSTITAAQRKSFNDFVAAYATTDIFGDLRNPSGKALFQKLNQNLENSGQARVLTCVSPIAVPFANLNSALGSAASSSLELDILGVTTGSKILVFATPPLSQGTTFVKNRLRLIGIFDGDIAQALDVALEYEAKFTNLAVGQNIYVGVKVVNSNGQASPLETVKSIIAA